MLSRRRFDAYADLHGVNKRQGRKDDPHRQPRRPARRWAYGLLVDADIQPTVSRQTIERLVRME